MINTVIDYSNMFGKIYTSKHNLTEAYRLYPVLLSFNLKAYYHPSLYWTEMKVVELSVINSMLRHN